MEFCADEAAQGTRYAEVTFTAAAHGERVGDLGLPLEAALDGLAEGRARHGIECRVLLDHSRRRPVERMWRTYELATRHDEAITLGHTERLGHGMRVLDDDALVAEARERGLPLEAGLRAGVDAWPATPPAP
ncbi:hypothetical protein [Nonomuraea candida]|uniref:hypothetical protein n=1 Tax=Nonomuraea candida TaxID=359159 RepID=UPI00069320BD|nr:hypothetical protein [Nonomuraea candida]